MYFKTSDPCRLVFVIGSHNVIGLVVSLLELILQDFALLELNFSISPSILIDLRLGKP